ncbi:glycosyltransferase [Winogradskyella eckloniae]|uniref:glycosyltransferase n=1 Tax=Winogradskyella eckloniae TaxID=1089306 RepID=UPI00156398F2|nr:glycosyltransferase [Winogradskyella eckloniae]NRD20153.1 glycosyltransferase [Winogradskyella eckloniae]
MRLGILIYSLSGGGAERVVSYLVSYCIKNNIEVHLILMNTTISYTIPANTKIHYLETSEGHESGFKKAFKIPFLAFKYAKLVKKLELTHSLSFLTRPSFINVIASKLTAYKFKVITNERAFPSLQYSYKGFQSSFNKTLIKTLYKKSDLVISNSYGNAGDLIDNFEVPSEKMKVIHNPIDLSKIEAAEPNTSFFDSDKFNIITLGRLDIGKNHEMLIRAIHQLQNPILRLYIFGVGDLKEEFEQLIETLDLKDQVFLMGFSANPYQYLKTADLFIFGSNHEGFPNVLLEAMACELPILSTNCQSGPSEIMELDNVIEDIMITDYGILVPIKNKDLMAKGIGYFVNHKAYADSCRENSKIRIKDFEKDSILKKYIDLVNSTTIAN